MKEKISFVIPIFNEEENISELYRRLSASLKNDFPSFDYEIILVNDGSTDSSQKHLDELHQKDNKVKVIEFSRNFGHHIAITAGLDYATGDYVVMMDGDLQDQPEEVIKLYNKLKTGADVVYGERIGKKFSFIKRLLSSLFNKTIKFLLNEDIVINSNIFRIMTKQVVASINELREQNRYIVGIIGWVGFKHEKQDVLHGVRYKGKTKYNLSRQINLALNAIFAFSDYLLLFITKVGLVFVLLSILMIFVILYKKIIFDTPVLGWSSLMTSILLIGGIQVVFLGIIGQYIGRVYMESKGRPLYVIKKTLK